MVWGAGVTGRSIGASLGTPLTAGNRVPVTPVLALAGHPNVYVVGDLAAIGDRQGGQPDGSVYTEFVSVTVGEEIVMLGVPE